MCIISSGFLLCSNIKGIRGFSVLKCVAVQMSELLWKHSPRHFICVYVYVCVCVCVGGGGL